MPKIVLLLVLTALIPYPMSAAESPADLQKYLQEARITKLDWLLLKAEVESFNQDIRWDSHGLINSVSLYSAKRALVGMTFLINKERYIALPEDIVKKVFADVVIEASNILKVTIPEVAGGANVYANFVTVGESGGVIAEYSRGKVSFTK